MSAFEIGVQRRKKVVKRIETQIVMMKEVSMNICINKI